MISAYADTSNQVNIFDLVDHTGAALTITTDSVAKYMWIRELRKMRNEVPITDTNL